MDKSFCSQYTDHKEVMDPCSRSQWWKHFLHSLLLVAIILTHVEGAAKVKSRQRQKIRQSPSPFSFSRYISNTHNNETPLAGNDCARQLFSPPTFRVSPDAYLTTPQMIAKYGYPVETHRVTSKDGYISTLFRIPHGIKNIQSPENFPIAAVAAAAGGNPPRPPVVLFHHGMTASSADWLMQPLDKTFPYLLANAGYEVWLANARGTTYSNKHVRLKSNMVQYWQWDWHEIGEFDIPVIIDYILATSGEPKLYYVGHSMGGSVFFVSMSMHPEYNDKIRSAYFFAPATFVHHAHSIYLVLTPLAPLLEAISFGESSPWFFADLIRLLGPLVCAPSHVSMTFCSFWLFILGGFDPCQLNSTESISLISGHAPDHISFRALDHYLQNIKSKTFRRYDFGPTKNLRKYGQPSPPHYDLAKVTARVATFWGPGDILVTGEDVTRLASMLPNLIVNHRVAWDQWSHLDFTYGMDAKPLVDDPVIRLMAKHY